MKSAERAEIMNFTPSIMKEGINWLAKKEPRPIFWVIYLQPFAFWIWVAVVIIFILSWLTFFLIEIMSSKTKHDHKSRHPQNTPFANGYNFGESFFVIVSVLTFGKLAIHPRMISARVFLVFLWLFSLIMMLTYTSYLLAYLYKPSTKASEKGSLDNILKKAGTYQWFWTDGDETFSTMLKAKNDSWAHKFAKIAKEKWKESIFKPRNETLHALSMDYNKLFFGDDTNISYTGMTVSAAIFLVTLLIYLS